MALLPLIIAPDPLLKTVSRLVEKIDESTRALVADMFETMYTEGGVGLAAVQVGVLQRILVADVTWRDGHAPGEQHVLINPEIVQLAPEEVPYNEGCLSFPDQYSEVIRPRGVRVKFQDLSGAWQEREFEGLLATCVQHEIDHLNGITFVDHISRLKREMIIKKLEKAKKLGQFDTHVHGEHCNH